MSSALLVALGAVGLESVRDVSNNSLFRSRRVAARLYVSEDDRVGRTKGAQSERLYSFAAVRAAGGHSLARQS